MVTADRADRAQLVLVAAIAIAFVVLGVVVVFNSVLYTQTISSGGTIEAGEDAHATVLEVDRGLSGLVQEVNRNGYGGDETAVTENMTAFAATYRNATAASRPSLVNVSASVGDEGTLIQNRSMEPVEDGSVLFTDTSGTEHAVEYLEVTLDTDDLSSPLRVEEPTGGHPITFREAAGGAVEVEADDGTTCELEPSGSNLSVEVVDGETDGTDPNRCLSDVAGAFDGSYSGLEFDGETRGTFELVLDADPGDIDDTDYDAHEAVVSLEATITYDSNDVAYDRTDEIRVYGDRP